MTTTGIAESLREIHRIHRQLTDLRERLDRGPKQIKARKSNLQQLQETVTVAHEKAKRTRMDTDSRELQLKEREERILDMRAKLNIANSNREYQTLLEQIAADEQANSVLSDEILELYDKLQDDQRLAAEEVQKEAVAQNELKTLTAHIDRERESLETELARLQNELTVGEQHLPAELKPEYNRMVKARGEDALAPIEGNVCAGCYQNITPQMINELALSKIVFCKNCGRLLYTPENGE